MNKPIKHYLLIEQTVVEGKPVFGSPSTELVSERIRDYRGTDAKIKWHIQQVKKDLNERGSELKDNEQFRVYIQEYQPLTRKQVI
jgi:hypothetical protein